MEYIRDKRKEYTVHIPQKYGNNNFQFNVTPKTTFAMIQNRIYLELTKHGEIKNYINKKKNKYKYDKRNNKNKEQKKKWREVRKFGEDYNQALNWEIFRNEVYVFRSYYDHRRNKNRR